MAKSEGKDGYVKDASKSPLGDGKGATQAVGPAKGDRNFIAESRRQPVKEAPNQGLPTSDPRQNRPQTPGSIEQRLGGSSRSIPNGGPSIQDTPSVASRGTGSQGNSGRPFKGMK